jgi:hypothetical protein
MNKSITVRAALGVATLLMFPLLQAATLSDADYSAGKTRIEAGLTSDKVGCGSLGGNANDICVEQAKGKAGIARAELEFAHSGKPADQNRILIARAESAYSVARERCDDLAGNVKDVCVEQAKATESKALAEAKLGKQIDKATTEAAVEMIDADYKVAAEKCDAFAGQAMTDCVASARVRFGKN